MDGVYTSILAFVVVDQDQKSESEIGLLQSRFYTQGISLGILVHSGNNKHSESK